MGHNSVFPSSLHFQHGYISLAIKMKLIGNCFMLKEIHKESNNVPGKFRNSLFVLFQIFFLPYSQ